MLPAPPRILMLMTAFVLASCDGAAVPKACRTEAVTVAEAAVKQAETAVIQARMMGPSPLTGIARPPDFEPDPVAAQAVSRLRHARFKLAEAVARCG